MTVWDVVTLCMAMGLALPAIWLVNKRRPLAWPAFSLAALGSGLLGYGSLIEPHLIDTTHHSARFPAWPTAPLRIALISDIHVGPYTSEAMIQRLVQMTNAQHPDVVLVAGDFTARSDTPALPQLQALRSLRARLGTWAVLGNHDYAPGPQDPTLLATLREAKVQLLRNASTHLLPGLELVGVDSLWAGRDDVAKAVQQVPPDSFAIALVHEPDAFGQLVQAKIPLAMAGHSHGGQLALPFWGPLVVLPDFSPAHDSPITRLKQKGWFERGTTRMLVTGGVGSSGPRARLFCRPEIAILTVGR